MLILDNTTLSCVAVAGVEVEVATPYMNWPVIGQQLQTAPPELPPCVWMVLPGIDIAVAVVVEVSPSLPWLRSRRDGVVALTKRSRSSVQRRVLNKMKKMMNSTVGVLVLSLFFVVDVVMLRRCCAVDSDYRRKLYCGVHHFVGWTTDVSDVPF